MRLRRTDKTTPESSPGGPVYDARIDPAIGAAQIHADERLAAQVDLHLWGDKTAPAGLYSHYAEQQPSHLAVQVAQLAYSRDQIERIVSRKDLPPYPGVELGHVPAFSRSPSAAPVLGGVQHLRFHAHQVEHPRTTRARFGH